MNYTFTFQDPLATRLELSGGKGSNLAILTPELLTQESIKMSAFCVKMPPEWSSAGAIVNLERRFSFG